MAAQIGIGLAALGRPGYINLGHGGDFAGSTEAAAMEQRTHAVLDAAYAAGVRYYDAARSYGRAEEFLGAWLRAQPAEVTDTVTVASKWGYTYIADWRVDADVHEVKDLTLATLERQTTETRTNLGSYLQIYQVHSATIESGVLEDAAVMEELTQLRENGTQIGLSVTGPKQADTILRALEVGGFDAVQATWNLLEQSAGAALAEAAREGLRVIVKEAVANGKLTDRGSVPALATVADRLGATRDAVAIAAVLAQPWVSVVLSGATTVAMLESNLTASELALDDQAWLRLQQLASDPVAYWKQRSALAWN